MPDRDYNSQQLARRPGGGMGRLRPFGSWGGNPWKELEQMRRDMDDLFTGFFGRGFGAMQPRWMGRLEDEAEPDVDVFENDGEFIIHAALPGVKPEDIKVDATDDSIQISAEYTSFQEAEPGTEKGSEASKNLRQHRHSRYSRQGSFSFAYSFPQEIRAQEARADFNNGRLELHLPKVLTDASAGRVRQIPISTGAQPAIGSSTQTGGAKSTGSEANKPADLRTETSTQKQTPKPEPGARKKAA